MDISKKLPQSVVDEFAALSRRTQLFPIPDRGFDPRAASPDTLRTFGLPVPQDYPRDSPGYIARHHFLDESATDGPIKFLAALSEDNSFFPTLSRAVTDAPWPAQKSNNWSGGYVLPRPGQSLTGVTAKWTVPAVAAPGGAVQPEYQSSTWIGLDGQRDYPDSTLPQIGTQQIWTTATGVPTYGTWFQWWAKGQYLGPQQLNLPVSSGHVVQAMLTVVDSITVRFNIKNVTLGLILQAFDVVAPPQTVVAGATAEWIMERPSPLGSDGWSAYRLPAFQGFSFTECSAESKPPGGTMPETIDLELAKLIRMYEITQAPPAVQTISLPTKILQPPQRLDLTYTGP